MLAASITELKDTMAVKFDQLEHILTRPDIWVLDTEAMMPRKTTQTTIVVVLPRGRACSDEDVIFQAPSYAIIFLFLLFVYGVFSYLCTSKKKFNRNTICSPSDASPVEKRAKQSNSPDMTSPGDEDQVMAALNLSEDVAEKFDLVLAKLWSLGLKMEDFKHRSKMFPK